jgi:hypothetical protein
MQKTSTNSANSINKSFASWVWCFTPVILALGKPRQEDQVFQASLGYMLNPASKKERKERNKRRDGGALWKRQCETIP